MQREMPKLAHPTGDIDSRNAPTWPSSSLDYQCFFVGQDDIVRYLESTYIECFATTGEEHI